MMYIQNYYKVYKNTIADNLSKMYTKPIVVPLGKINHSTTVVTLSTTNETSTHYSYHIISAIKNFIRYSCMRY